MGCLKHILVYLYTLLFLIIHLMITFNEGLSVFSSGYFYYFLAVLSIPLLIFCIVYFWFYFKFPKHQKSTSILFLFTPVILVLFWILIKDYTRLIEYFQREELVQNNMYEPFLRFAITGFPLAILMGLLLDILMKWFVRFDKRVENM